MVRRLRIALCLLGLCLLAWPAWAGLRPLYGGELVLIVPAAPQTTVPTQAWSPAEVLLASALGGRLANVVEGPPIASSTSLHFAVRGDAVWPDGSVLDARSLAANLRASLGAATVALPPFTFRSEGRELIVEFPVMADPVRYLDLPWLRLARAGEGGAFRLRRATVESDTNGLGGRAFTDRIRVEVKETRKLEPTANGIAMMQPGVDGRPVFALPRPGGAELKAIVAALATIDRAGIAKLFVRTASHVPDGWPLHADDATAAAAKGPIVLAVDATERDQRTVAERLQVLLRDRKVVVHIVAEDRATYLARLTRGDYDLAIVALPPAPRAVQAATLLRLASGKAAVDQFWGDALLVSGARQEEALLKQTAGDLGAALLYVEEGGLAHGSHVHDASTALPWELDLGNVWLGATGTAP
jgi:hypothetical protein